MNIATVRRYASGKAPFLGVPVFSLTEGRYVTALFRRQHLHAAASCPHITKVTYDEQDHVLVLNGSPRACYRLKDLKYAEVNGNRVAWGFQLRSEQEQWAQGRRKSKVTRSATPEARRIVKLQEEIGKLERRLAKIHPRLPIHPLLPGPYGWSKGDPDAELQWRASKQMRRELGWLAHRPRTTWKQFYADVAAIIGHTLDSSVRHDKVCNRKHGPSIVGYLTHLPQYIHLAHKPYRSDFDSFRKGWGGEADLDRFQQHRVAQGEYLQERSECEAIRSQMEAHRMDIEQMRPAVSGE